MYRQIAAILLFVAFAAQSFHGTLLMLDYYSNTSAYARNCENKTRFAIRCKGKCQLMKKLQEEERKNQQNPERKSENKNEVLYSPTLCIDEPFIFTLTHPFLPATDAGEEVAMPRQLLRPPIG